MQISPHATASRTATTFAADHVDDFERLGARGVEVDGSTVSLRAADPLASRVLGAVLKPAVAVSNEDGSTDPVTLSVVGPVAAPVGIADVVAAVAKLQGVTNAYVIDGIRQLTIDVDTDETLFRLDEILRADVLGHSVLITPPDGDVSPTGWGSGIS